MHKTNVFTNCWYSCHYEMLCNSVWWTKNFKHFLSCCFRQSQGFLVVNWSSMLMCNTNITYSLVKKYLQVTLGVDTLSVDSLVLNRFFVQGIAMNLSLWKILAGENNLFSVIYWWQGWICGGSGREHGIKGYFLQLNECPGFIKEISRSATCVCYVPTKVGIVKGNRCAAVPSWLIRSAFLL